MKVLDLFSGIGGFSLGLENAGFETVAFCEIDKKARAVLAKHWPNVKVFEDVTQLTKEKLDEHGISVDVICGGFPCQDISVAGKGAGLEGARSGLWFEFHRLIKEIRPSWVIVENVSALRSRGLDAVLRSLFEIGYDAEWHCIPASAVGAPHRRDRVWVVGYPNSTGSSSQRAALATARLKQCGELGSFLDVAYSDSEWQLQSEGIEQDKRRRLGDGGQDVADSPSEGLSERRRPKQQESATKATTGMVTESKRCSKNVSDTMRERLEGQRSVSGGVSEEQQDASDSCWWAVEPDVGRVAHGVPGRVDRLKQLGNAVVPQIPELIGKAIMDAHYG